MLSKGHRGSNPALGINSAGNVSSSTGLQNTGGSTSDGDDNLFFELSESSGRNSGISTPGTMKSSGETTPVFTPLDVVENGGHFDVQQPHVPERQLIEAGTRSARERRDTPARALGAVTEGSEQHVVLTTRRSSRRSSTESAIIRSYEDPCPGLLSERVVVSSSAVGVHHEVDNSQQDKGAAKLQIPAEKDGEMRRVPSATQAGLLQTIPVDLYDTASKPTAFDIAAEDGVEAESQSLDLALAMRPLIPSYLPGSAEIRVCVHGILIPCNGNPPASAPYVRASLHPGARSIARTGLPVIGPTWTTAPNVTNNGSSTISQGGGLLLAEHCPAERGVEYLFSGEDGGANGNQHVLSLPLEPFDVGIMSERNGGTSPPTMRLEIVSGRSLGWCDLALPEALRRPGGTFQKLQLPVWKKERPQGSTKRNSMSEYLSLHQERTAAGEQGCDEGGIVVGQINLDLGVMLTGEPEGSLSEAESGALELTTGVVAVEAIDICIRDSGGRRVEMSGVQQTQIIGVSAALALGGGKTKLAVFGAEGCGRKGPEGSGPECVPEGGLSLHGGKVVLKSTCAELDVLTLRLVRRKVVKSSSSSDLGLGGKGADQRQGEGGGGDVVKIAVSDVNEIFDGRSRWVKMHHDCFEGDGVRRKGGYPGENAVSELETGGARRWLEVHLRVSLADTTPLRHHEHRRATSKEEGLSVTDPGSRRKSSSLTDPHTEQNLTTAVKDREDPLPVGGAPRSALEAWMTSPGNGCTQAHAVVSSLGNHKLRGATLHPRGNSECYPSQVGPGILEVGVIAIHGRGQQTRPATAIGKEGSDGGNRQASIRNTSPPWWVRVTYPNERGRARGENGVSVMDSPPGEMSPLEEGDLWRDGDPAIAAPPLQQHEMERCGCGWIVHWPRGDGVLARCPVHWTLSQTVLPVVYLEVFWGQVRF